MARFIYGLAVLALLGACTPIPQGERQVQEQRVPEQTPEQIHATPAGLSGGEWAVFEIGGAAVIPDSAPSIAFADGRVSGAGSCNRFTGGHTLAEDGKIAMSQMASTMMMCPDALMRQEETYLKLLGAVTGWSIDGDVLTLSAADGRTIRARR